ncbi:hypothetical protein GW17_00008972 [Ensete ventricosum]|nr:hypothetical protein GW17_00008972 [Ensete ventricosum]
MSGFSKSTLIDALANHIMWESLQGSITLNSEKLEGYLLKMTSAYIMQDDLMYPTHAHYRRDFDVLQGVLATTVDVCLKEEESSTSTHQVAQPLVCYKDHHR